MNTQSVKTKKGSATLLEPGIIKYTLKDHSEWTLDDAREIHAANMQLSNGGKYFTFMHAKKIFLPTKEAQEFIASKECTDHRIAAVLVVQNTGIKLLANLFIKFFKSKSSGGKAVRYRNTFGGKFRKHFTQRRVFTTHFRNISDADFFEFFYISVHLSILINSIVPKQFADNLSIHLYL